MANEDKGLVDVTTGIERTDANANGVLDLTSGIVTQISNIGVITISGVQWGYVGAMDQGVTTTSSPTFNFLTTTGGRISNLTVVNVATYDLLVSDYILSVSYTITGAVTSLTLPTAQMVNGRIIHIKDVGLNAATNNITVDTEGGELIEGQVTLVIDSDGASISLVANGANWWIF